MAGEISGEQHYRLADLIVAQQRYDAAHDEAQAKEDMQIPYNSPYSAVIKAILMGNLDLVLDKLGEIDVGSLAAFAHEGMLPAPIQENDIRVASERLAASNANQEKMPDRIACLRVVEAAGGRIDHEDPALKPFLSEDSAHPDIFNQCHEAGWLETWFSGLGEDECVAKLTDAGRAALAAAGH